MELTPMTQMTREALRTADPEAGGFPEGVMAAIMLEHRQSDMRYFMKDLLEGVRNIGSAAVVVAELYENSDDASAANLADIRFAFSDAGSSPPAGFRPVESWNEYEARTERAAGTHSMAATGDDSLARVVYPAAGVSLYYYPDGSSKQVVRSTVGGSSYEQGTRTETTVHGPGGKVLERTTSVDTRVHGGYRNQTTETVRGEGDERSSTKSSTVTHPDGTLTVTSETTSMVPGKDGKLEPHVVKSDPVTIEPGTHVRHQPVGPVEQAEQDTGSKGTRDHVAQYGPGY
jgi:hypothetical protein